MQADTAPAYCPVCKNAGIVSWNTARDYEYFSVPGTFNYYQCNECATIFIDPVPVEQLKQIYPSNYYSFSGHAKNIVTSMKAWLDKVFFKKILKQIKAPVINVLDIGGGSGWLLSQLKKIEPRIALTQVVDIDTHAGLHAVKNGHDYFKGTIEQYNTATRFQLILMLNLIEHVADPLAVLKKAGSLLEPGGRILIKTPNTKSLDARIFRNTYWGGLHCPRHWIIFSEKSFRIMLSNTDLEIEKLQYTQGAPFWAFSIIASLHSKKLVKVSENKPIIYHWLFGPLSAIFATFDFIRRPFAKTSQMFIVLKKF